MDRHTPTVAEVVSRAVEVCDPEGADPDLGRLQEVFEDDDAPVTAVERLDERLAMALEGVDNEAGNPAVAVATAIVLYLAETGGDGSFDGDEEELIRLAVRRQWRGDAPESVEAWVGAR